MSKRIFRAVSILLIPCLAVDSAFALGWTTPSLSAHEVVDQRTNQHIFQQEALTLQIRYVLQLIERFPHLFAETRPPNIAGADHPDEETVLAWLADLRSRERTGQITVADVHKLQRLFEENLLPATDLPFYVGFMMRQQV